MKIARIILINLCCATNVFLGGAVIGFALQAEDFIAAPVGQILIVASAGVHFLNQH